MNENTELAVIKEVVLRLEHRLFGNGQPGVIEEHSKRIAKLENWRWWVVGIAVGLGIALGAGGTHIIEAMSK